LGQTTYSRYSEFIVGIRGTLNVL